MTGMRWGRLQADVNCQLRRGAWYRVTQLASLEAVLDVNRKPVTVPQYMLEVVSTPPAQWTVVPTPRHAVRLFGAKYAVCPNCRERTRLDGQPRHLRCERCRGEFEVAWSEGYLAER